MTAHERKVLAPDLPLAKHALKPGVRGIGLRDQQKARGVAVQPVHYPDAPLLGPTLAGLDKLGGRPEAVTVHLDRGYDGGPTRALLEALGFDGAIARTGVPAPVQAGARWVVERTHSWMNGYGKLRRCTEKAKAVVDFYLFLAAALVVVRQLIHRARSRYRWPSRPTTRRLK